LYRFWTVLSTLTGFAFAAPYVARALHAVDKLAVFGDLKAPAYDLFCFCFWHKSII
jgi:hypothetical protein